MTMTRSKLLLAAASCLSLSACLGGPKAPPELLTLTSTQTRTPGEARAGEQGRVITVVSPTVPQAISNTRVPVYVSPTSIQYLKDAQWVEKPNELFRHLLSETLAAQTGWVVLDPSVYAQVQGVVLGGQLLAFGLDPNRMEAVVAFDASLARPQQAVATRRFEARIPVTAAERSEVAAALNQAANRVAADVSAWVG
jgi:cholesterol transport system auxiliary component